MNSVIPGIIKPELQSLPQIVDRLTFIYLEHCIINRRDSAITVTDEKGCIDIPAAAISVLMLGPGTNITHRAMELIGDAGVGVVWVGDHGVRFYANGRPMTHRSKLLIRQAELASNNRLHLNVVRQMYSMRFPDEDVSKLTLQQLRGREGARIRAVYKNASKAWNIPWNGREYNPSDYSESDLVNQALSAGHACLYGLAHAVISALGCSAGLGFVHIGHENSFVYDIADLYKADITIPLAFQVAAEHKDEDIGRIMRIQTREAMVKNKTLECMVRDIKRLLSDNDSDEESEIYLWDNKLGMVENAKSY